MAYFIFNTDNEIVKIAANDTDRDALNLNLPDYNVVSVTDDQFNSVISNEKKITYEGTTLTLTGIGEEVGDIDPEIGRATSISCSQVNLEKHIGEIKKLLKYFLVNNSEHIKFTECQNYYNYLDNLDMSTLTFPLDGHWEKYCIDNSIPFIHPLQIP
tara:strand:- start:2660 stop:3130 length:471 start_codon:yes stop_codon:yes gene_type:complete